VYLAEKYLSTRGNDMTQASRASFEKRRRDRAKRQKRLDKIARRQQRKDMRQSGTLRDDDFSPGQNNATQE
jgi:hypothetical protein